MPANLSGQVAGGMIGLLFFIWTLDEFRTPLVNNGQPTKMYCYSLLYGRMREGMRSHGQNICTMH